MSTAFIDSPGRVVLATTVDVSIGLMSGFPEFLAKCGWDVHLVSSGGPRLKAYEGQFGITTHTLPMARRPKPLSDAKALVEWVRLLRRIRPDVVAVGTPKAGLLSMIAGACVGVRRRVYILRGLRVETASGIGRRLLAATEWLTMSCSHIVLAVSPSLKVRARQMQLCPANKIVVLGRGSSNGVNLATFFAEAPARPVEWNFQAGIPVVGYVGRITADKGLQHLADALRLMGQGGFRCQLLLIGQIDGDSGPDMVQHLIDTGQHVIQGGHVNDPRAAYGSMDLICLPSLREGFPNVVLEAAACGRPAVVSDATGNVDAVIDGVTGYIVPIGDPEGLAGALIQLLSNDDLRRRMGTKAREHVARDFEQAQVWRRTESLIRCGTDACAPLPSGGER